MRYSKCVINTVIVLNVVALAIFSWLYHEHGSEPTVLIGAWFAFTTGELWKLADIKKEEIRNERVPKEHGTEANKP